MAKDGAVTGTEVSFGKDEIIVSKTDLKGTITYANRLFLDIAGYKESEVIGQPHSLIRHPHMPRCVFKLLWDTVASGQEIFAYVVNRCKNGDHYWVYAHVTPTFDAAGKITGYHSNRRLPEREIILESIQPLYTKLRAEEEKHGNRKEGLQASSALLMQSLADQGLEYDEFVMTLGQGRRRGYRTAQENDLRRAYAA